MRQENPEPSRSRILSAPQADTAFAHVRSSPAASQSRRHFPGALPTEGRHEASSPCHSQFPEFSFLPMTPCHGGRASTIIRYLVPEFEERTMDSRTSMYLGAFLPPCVHFANPRRLAVPGFNSFYCDRNW